MNLLQKLKNNIDLKLKDINALIKKYQIKGLSAMKKSEKLSALKLLLNNMTTLKNKAKALNIDNLSKLKKVDLINEIIKKRNEKKKYEKIIKRNERLIKKKEDEEMYDEISKVRKVIKPKDRITVMNDFKDFKRVRIETNSTNKRQLFNKIEEYKTKYLNEGSVVQFVILYAEDKNYGGIRNVSVEANALYDYNSFKDWFKVMEHAVTAADQYESDALSELDYNIIYNKFDLVMTRVLQGNGRSDKMIFKTMNIVGLKNKCGYNCLKELIPELKLTVDEYMEKEMYLLDNMKLYIDENKLKIRIIGNTFKIRNMKYLLNKKEMKITKVDKFDMHLKELNMNEIKLCRLHNVEDYEHTIILDIEKQHYDIIDKKVELDNVYISLNGCFYKKKNDEYVKLMSIQSLNKKNITHKTIKSIDVKTEYIFFDYETVIDWKYGSVNKPYSLAFFHADDELLEKLDGYDKTENIEKIKEIIKENAVFSLSHCCTVDLYDYINSNDKDKVFILISFNGCNFDNFILYNDLSELDPDSLGEPFFNGTRLLNFKIKGRHSTFDMRKHVIGNLSRCCQSFKIKTCAKKQFDFKYAQNLYDNGILIDTLEKDIDNIKEYNIFDVLSLALLYYRYKKAITNIDGFEKYGNELHNNKTLGSLMMKKFKSFLKEKNIKLPNFFSNDEEIQKRLIKYYDDAVKNKIGGRVQLPNGMIKLIEELLSLDACSLYPYVMAVYDNYFPCGEMVEIDSYEKMDKNKLGMFYCDVDQSELYRKNMISILPEKTLIGNDWDSKNILKNIFISTVKIDILKKYGCDVKIYNGIYFTEKVKSCEIFEFLLPLMQEKNRQDEYSRNGSLEYNPALREVMKLFLNVLSGKLIEGLHLEKLEEVTSYRLYQLLNVEKVKNVKYINMEKKTFITYEKNKEDCMKKTRPIYMGIFIYDYSQKFMYENLYSKIPKEHEYYTDTDSLKIDRESFDNWFKGFASTTIVPHWPEVEKYDNRYKDHKLYNKDSKVFGSFENEYEHKNNNINYFICKKNYLGTNKEEPTEDNTTFRFKGISKNDILLDDSVDYKGMDNEELYHLYNKSKKIKDNYILLFEKLYNEGHCKVLTQSFTRSIVKENNIENSSKAPKLSIICNYRIKNIIIKRD